MKAMYQSIKRKRAEEGTNSGFTLIELLIVIVVLGILAAIVVFSLGTITGKSAVAACQADAQQLNTGLAAYYASIQTYPAQSTTTIGTTAATGEGFVGSYPTALAPTYLQTLPDNKNHYLFTYTFASSVYTLSVIGVGGTSPSTQVISTNATSGGVGAAAACAAAGIA